MIVPCEKRHLHSHCIFLSIFIIFNMKIYVYEYKYRPKHFIDNSLYILIDKESVQCVENMSGFISDS